jgi:glycopeptide antibiotics resistance protein
MESKGTTVVASCIHQALTDSYRYTTLRDTTGRIGLTTLFGAAFSILIEVSQYLFQLGFSDIDDFLFNTLGAAAGACIAAWAGPRARWLWISLTAVLVVVFAVLIILGPRLGDPDRVVEVNAASYTMDHRSPLFI